jgi:hypothetical protein
MCTIARAPRIARARVYVLRVGARQHWVDGAMALASLLCACVVVLLLGVSAAWQLPRWDPVWQLNRSTIAQPCNNSGWLGPELPGGGDIGEFGLLSFDWANNRANWRAQQPNRCEEDLLMQAIAAKRASRAHTGPETKVFVYRGGEMCLNVMTDQRELMGDLPSNPNGSFAEYPYKGYWVAYTNGTIWANRPACYGHCMGQLIWDFRNKSAADYYVNTVVGSSDFGVGNPNVDGMFLVSVSLNSSLWNPLTLRSGVGRTTSQASAPSFLGCSMIWIGRLRWSTTGTKQRMRPSPARGR